MEWCDKDDIFSVNIDNDIGRGVNLYVHKSLIKMETIFQENLSVRIRTNVRDEMLIGLIYRSDSGTEENNIALREIIMEASSKKFASFLLMGDFNYPSINWDTNSSKSTNSEEHHFIRCLQVSSR
jgi:hypothetical protein